MFCRNCLPLYPSHAHSLAEGGHGMHGFSAHSVMHSEFSSWSHQSIMHIVAGDLRGRLHSFYPSSLLLFLPSFLQIIFLEHCSGSRLGARYWWYTMNKTNTIPALMKLRYSFFFMPFLYGSVKWTQLKTLWSGGRETNLALFPITYALNPQSWANCLTHH